MVIEAINADGRAIPPLIIGGGQYHLATQYSESNIPGDWAIATTQNGWTGNEIGLEWLKHFDRCTVKRSNSRYGCEGPALSNLKDIVRRIRL